MPVRLFVQREANDRLDLIVKCERLAPGRACVVERRTSLRQRSADRTIRFSARGSTFAFHDTIVKSRPAFYRCRRAE